MNSPEGEVFQDALDCLLRQPWWMPTAAKEKRLASTEILLREYQRRWPVRSALLWIAIATHPKSKGVRTGSEGAFVYAHLRGYGRQGWNPESKSAKERTLHVAVLRCDEVATFAALGLESSYAPQNRATAWKQSESQGAPPSASSAGNTGGSASLDRAADEATSCLGDIPGWMLSAPGQDKFEQQRNRLHATRALAGRLTVRCMIADVANLLLALFRSETKELQERGITARWVQQALEAEAIGKAPLALPGLPEFFWSHVLAGDYKRASMSLTEQSATQAAME
ncbi:MAG: hypothetical protein COA70_13855 [Planctomycetota bacterium]|nr:MAG: hypothetical protein COA70_13855 [Planctomycetota bacterium]